MDLWGLPLEEAEEPLLHSSSVAPSKASISPPPPTSKKPQATQPNLTQMLHEIPHYHDVAFEPLEVAESFPPTVQLLSGVDIESSYMI
jgi:hypothetical protein